MTAFASSARDDIREATRRAGTEQAGNTTMATESPRLPVVLFCGSASAFNGHASDTTELLRRGRGALTNTAANLGLALGVFLIGIELERLLSRANDLDVSKDGLVDLFEVGAHYGLMSAPPLPPPPHKRFLFF